MNIKNKDILKSLQNIEKLEKSISMLSSITLKNNKSTSPRILKMSFKSPIKKFQKPKPKKLKPALRSPNPKHHPEGWVSPLCLVHRHQGCTACCQKKSPPVHPPQRLKTNQSPNKSLLRQKSICIIKMDSEYLREPGLKIEKFKTVLENQLDQINQSLYKSKFKLEAAKSMGSLKNLVKSNFQTFKERWSKLPENSIGEMSTTCFKNYSFQQQRQEEN